jgi:DNA-binding NtrC family response regulator
MEVSVGRASSPASAILLVDDSIVTRAPLAELLREIGYLVLEAASSDDALDLLNSRLEIETLIAHELVQGSMGGLALADWVRRTRPEMRVLVVSEQEQVPDVPDKEIVFVLQPHSFTALRALLPPVASGP